MLTEMSEYCIRPIRPGEGAVAAAIEQACFPPNEAAKPEIMVQRAEIAPELFFAAEREGQVIGFTTALAVDGAHLVDDYFTNPGLHRREGAHVMILSVAVLPEHRGRGVGGALIKALADYARGRGKESLVLTCLKEKVKFYAGLGFRDLGDSDSQWGGDSWHEMVMIFKESEDTI